VNTAKGSITAFKKIWPEYCRIKTKDLRLNNKANHLELYSLADSAREEVVLCSGCCGNTSDFIFL